MSIVPTRIQDLLEFCEQHGEAWTNSAAQIGLSSQAAINFNNACNAARAAYNAHLATIEADRAAVEDQNAAVLALRRAAGDNIRTIKAFAEQAANPLTVYNLAQIPPPQPPSAMPPPGTPFNFKAGLNTDGSITMNWKCNNPKGSTGTVYNIRRKAEGESAFTFIGAVGTRKFTDTTIPAGANRCEYLVTGQRAQSVGQPSSPFVVLFGQAGGGGFAITGQFEETGGGSGGVGAKLAA